MDPHFLCPDLLNPSRHAPLPGDFISMDFKSPCSIIIASGRIHDVEQSLGIEVQCECVRDPWKGECGD